MHILCTICSDLLNQAETLYVTKCGHLFHHQCLAQWIERSRSCPQCRNKVTEKCMYRIYPTISNDNSGEDVTKVQSRLDDAQLQLRQYKASCSTYEAKITELTANLKSNGELLRKTEKNLINKEAVISTMKQQWEFYKINLQRADKLEKENEELKKNIEILNGLQNVLNATSNDVEEMLKDYGDLRTIATFASALKRALLESESRKAETRARLQLATQQLADQRAELWIRDNKLLQYERRLEILKNKRKAAEGAEDKDAGGGEDRAGAGVGERKRARTGEVGGGGGEADDSVVAQAQAQAQAQQVGQVQQAQAQAQAARGEQAESPYLRLRRAALAGPALRPSEYALLKCKGARPAGGSKAAPASPPQNRLSIFYKKPPLGAGAGAGGGGAAYDGLGGRARPDPLPAPARGCPPRLSARPRLRPPAPPASRDIALMLQKTPAASAPAAPAPAAPAAPAAADTRCDSAQDDVCPRKTSSQT